MTNNRRQKDQKVWAFLMIVTAFCLAFMLLASAVFADDRIASMKAAEADMLAFIEEHTDYNVDDLPEVTYVFKTQEELNLIYYGPQAKERNESFNVQAVYLPPKVLMIDTFDINLMSHVLLHELVHHAQVYNNREFECLQEAEREAYILMDKWIDKVGVGEKTDPLFMLFMRCRAEMEYP